MFAIAAQGSTTTTSPSTGVGKYILRFAICSLAILMLASFRCFIYVTKPSERHQSTVRYGVPEFIGRIVAGKATVVKQLVYGTHASVYLLHNYYRVWYIYRNCFY